MNSLLERNQSIGLLMQHFIVWLVPVVEAVELVLLVEIGFSIQLFGVVMNCIFTV